jgi:hypothetical protein
LIAFHDIENLMPMEEPIDKTRMFWTLLKDQSSSYLEHQLRRNVEAEDLELPDDDFIELCQSVT